jgi:hypothetical protein
MPAAPAELMAERHGSNVDVRFVVPATNTDNTRPANISRVDVYAITGPETITDEQLVKFGTKISSIPVKAPRDPNQTSEPDEVEDVELQGEGLDQGARAHVMDRLTAETAAAVDVTNGHSPEAVRRAAAKSATTDENAVRPLTPAPMLVASRLYAAIPVSTRGRNGPSSARVRIAMVPPPPTLQKPEVTYDETVVTVTWPPLPVPGAEALPEGEKVLPSRPFGTVMSKVAYNVYEVSDQTTPPALTKLTGNPLTAARFAERRVVWGEKRCYAVRVFLTVEQVSLEGDESPAGCVTFTDTFAPAVPRGVQAVPSEGAISLIWDANAESDLRGYIVLRGPVSSEKLEPLTAEPIQETSFQDKVPPGTRYVYAVQAVDRAGNVSAMSARVEETAR